MKPYPITTTIISITALAILTATLLVGCISVGNKTVPKATADFTPKQVYAVTYDKLWDTTMNALDKNRIAAITANKESGIIQTDYTDGASTLILGGFAGAQHTRYKYNISLRNEAAGGVKLNIICKVESTIFSGQGSSQWSDVSGENTKLVKQREDWLYEQIEKGL
jgi:hypothetical protein